MGKDGPTLEQRNEVRVRSCVGRAADDAIWSGAGGRRFLRDELAGFVPNFM